MLKYMTLGRRIAGGFTLVLILAVALGGLAIFNVKPVQSSAVDLTEETVPSMHSAANVERNILRAMWYTLNYSYSANPDHLKAGREFLTAANKEVDACEKIAQQHEVAELTKAAKEAREAIDQYDARIDETVKSTESLAATRANMASAGSHVEEQLKEYLAAQIKSMRDEITAVASADKLNERLRKVEQTYELCTLAARARRSNYQAQALRDPEILKPAVSDIEHMNGMIKEIVAITHQQINLDRLNAISASLNRYQTGLQEVFDSSLRDTELAKARAAAASRAQAIAQQTTNDGFARTESTAQNAAASLSAAVRNLLTGLSVVVTIGAALAFVIARSIIRPMTRITTSLAEGAEQTSSAATQVSSASQSLAQGASEQAASLEETSSSLEEMSSMTRRNADTSVKASQLSATAQKSANEGNASMQKMSEAIHEIEKSASETAKIIKAIDEIAFQTNLLALNAAVEAARAGDAGKGFAVVADEVRNLAMRSAEAARNTQTMIEESMEKSRRGVQIADEVGKSLADITTAATSVNQLVGEISAASNEQAQGIGQVTTAVSQMDKITQTNAASAEESAAAAEELSSQSEQLRGIVTELSMMMGIKSGRSSHSRNGALAKTKLPTAKDAIPLSQRDGNGHDFGEFNKAA